MKILITGGAGCLGSNIIEHYLPQKYEICVIDNFSTGSRELVPKIKGLTLIEGSVDDQELVNKTFESFMPEVVIHSAASYKDPLNWHEDTSSNIIGTINVIRASEKINIKRFVNFQTALCYGRPSIVPIPVDHPTKPFTSYGISKTSAEQFLMISDIPVISLRLANICGPRLSIGPIPTFYQRLKANKDCFCSDAIRDFMDMSDFLSLLDIIFSSDHENGIFNVSTGVGSSVKDVFIEVANYLNIEVPDVPIVPIGDDDVKSVILDPSLTENTFSWKAKIDFKTTISRQLEWYDKYGISAIHSHLQVPKEIK
tara:strand:- start:2454 stop:3389 length:936 start_codon:yes stop_codon:yes gene_type:complete